VNPTDSCRVLFLTLYPETMPSSRLRVYQYLPLLGFYGIHADVAPALPEPWFSRFYYSKSRWMKVLQFGAELVNAAARAVKSRSYDLVVIQKGLLLSNFKDLEKMFSNSRVPVVFDLDDAIYGRGIVEFQNPFLRSLQDPSQPEKITALAKAVIAGNSYLKELAEKYNPQVYQIPTPVDTDRFSPLRNSKEISGQKVVIGWIGMGMGLIWLRMLDRVFQELARRFTFRLKVVTRVGETLYNIQGVDVETVNWSYDEEVSEMQSFDIGVMPLSDDEWTRGKCSYKLLQYMAMGIPSVSSRVGMNQEVVSEGVNGMLASDSEEWIEKLSRLIQSVELRAEMGRKARERVCESYSLDRMAPVFANVLLRTAGSSPISVLPEQAGISQ